MRVITHVNNDFNYQEVVLAKTLTIPCRERDACTRKSNLPIPFTQNIYIHCRGKHCSCHMIYTSCNSQSFSSRSHDCTQTPPPPPPTHTHNCISVDNNSFNVQQGSELGSMPPTSPRLTPAVTITEAPLSCLLKHQLDSPAVDPQH